MAWKILAAAAVVSAVSFGATALAAPVSPAAIGIPLVATSDGNVQLAAMKKDDKKVVHKKVVNKKFVYNPSKHGKRYRTRRGGYSYYYGGYYYARPWWTIPGFGICIGC